MLYVKNASRAPQFLFFFFFQNSTKDRVIHLNISVTVKRQVLEGEAEHI